MAFGMEGRTPFIDKKLFKDLFYIDDKEKIRGFGKYYIRDYLKKKVTFYNVFEKKLDLQFQFMIGFQIKLMT